MTCPPTDVVPGSGPVKASASTLRPILPHSRSSCTNPYCCSPCCSSKPWPWRRPPLQEQRWRQTLHRRHQAGHQLGSERVRLVAEQLPGSRHRRQPHSAQLRQDGRQIPGPLQPQHPQRQQPGPGPQQAERQRQEELIVILVTLTQGPRPLCAFLYQ